MQRGIEYAKDEERIDNIRISKGQIFATVQGTAPTPYRVKINFETISEENWNKIINELTNKTLNLINLLEGVLPEEIVNIFEKSGFSLFPDASKEFNADCSCPDKAIPCKHIAAVILYISLVIDYNPFVLLELLGKTKDEILKDLNLNLTRKDESKPIEDKTENEINFEKNIKFSFNVPKIHFSELSKKKETIETLTKIGFQLKKPGKIIETLENLGIPAKLENPKAFENVFKSIYRVVTSELYKTSMQIEKN